MQKSKLQTVSTTPWGLVTCVCILPLNHFNQIYFYLLGLWSKIVFSWALERARGWSERAIKGYLTCDRFSIQICCWNTGHWGAGGQLWKDISLGFSLFIRPLYYWYQVSLISPLGPLCVTSGRECEGLFKSLLGLAEFTCTPVDMLMLTCWLFSESLFPLLLVCFSFTGLVFIKFRRSD